MARFGWLKKTGQVLLGIGKSGLLPVPGLPMAIETVEATVAAARNDADRDGVPDAPTGPSKFQQVVLISDGMLKAAGVLDVLSPEERAKVDAVRAQTIQDYVAYRNAEAQAKASFDQWEALIASFRRSAADGTGQP